jgi:hypothetical protein
VKGTEHVIIRGSIEDFVLHYIPEDSILIKPEILTNPEKIPTKEEKIFKEVMKKDYEYLISDEEILKLLNALPQNYCDDYAPWLKITTILKSLNKHTMWDEYSRKSYKYDIIRNNEIWDGLKESININWLISELNKDEVKYKVIEKMKKNEEIKLESEKINSKYISETIDIKILKKVKTLIIKSTTGTGKSSFTARCINEYLKRNKKSKVISIISRVKYKKIKNHNIQHHEHPQ